MPTPHTSAEKKQLFRFCLYGFLRNQQYFDPFLILAFQEKGLNFTSIGSLIAFRSVSVNILEIPSGVIADTWGRRRAMIVSMLNYILAFAIFALANEVWLYFPAMLAFSVGEAFRTGTHKAMIFDWLKRNGHANEKTKVYGLTRSWSKIGSALNVILAAGIICLTHSYVWVFWISIIPYFFNIVNFLLYPAYLDSTGKSPKNSSMKGTMFTGISQCLRRGNLRNIILENLCFEGFYSVAKDYLQPLLKAAALSAPILLSVSNQKRTAILVAISYASLNLLGSWASRSSHRFVKVAGSEGNLARQLWKFILGAYLLLALGIAFHYHCLPILGFIFLGALLNVWKPAFLSRFNANSTNETGATTLSVANQSKTLTVAVIAPILGYWVDLCLHRGNTPLQSLWPIAACGILFSLLGTILSRKKQAS